MRVNPFSSLAGALLLAGMPAWGAITNFTVQGRTATQVFLTYTAPDANPCRLEVSASSSYSPLVHDLDASLFTGADLDNRTGNFSNGTSRLFVVGKRATDYAADGRAYSRALQTDKQHYYRLTCGSDQLTGTFQTTTIPFGNTYMEALPADPTKPGQYLWPSVPSEADGQVVDPFTGVLFQRITDPSEGNMRNVTLGFAANPAPYGTNWANPSGILADGGTAASYGGTTSDWLFLSLGGQFPTDSSFGNTSLSYLNLYVKGSCSGSGCGAGGNQVDVCLTMDGQNCAGPMERLTLGATPSVIPVCNGGAPCPQLARNGDTFTTNTIGLYGVTLGQGRVYNNGYSSTLYFTDAADCNTLRPGDQIRFFSNDSNMRAQYPLVGQLNCSASPPQMTMQNVDRSPFSYAVPFGDVGGIPFYFSSGMAYNQRFGFMMRKVNPVSDATVQLDHAYVKSSLFLYPGRSSGGFAKICSNKKTANGFYHCMSGLSIYAIKPNADGSMESHFLGIPYFLGQEVSGYPSGFFFCGGTGSGDQLWDDEDPNILYCNSTNASGSQLIKMTYTGNDQDCGTPGSGCTPPNLNSSESPTRFPATVQNLTPGANSINAQLDQFAGPMTPSYNSSIFGRCGILAIQGKYAVGRCLSGEQDSLGWHFAMDLGNRQPIGQGYVGQAGNTQQVMAAAPVFARQPSRWCGLHTYQTMGKDPIATIEVAASKGPFWSVNLTQDLPACSREHNTCSPCPGNPAQKTCSAMRVTSSYPGTPPAGWAAGEPVTTGEPRMPFLQTAQVGDVFQHGTEHVRIVQKNGPGDWIVDRGIGPDQTWQYPIAHSAGSVFDANCYNGDVHWYFALDPKAEYPETYFSTSYVNHSTGRDGIRIAPKFNISTADFTDPIAMREGSNTGLADIRVDMPYKFAGNESLVGGNLVENHPSYNQVDAPAIDKKWFLDAHPYLGGGVADPGSVTRIEGDLYKYKYDPYFYVDKCRDTCDPRDAFQTKKADILAACAQNPLSNMSSPAQGNILTGARSDAFKYCVAERDDECRAGSKRMEIFFNCPNIDPSSQYCRGGEFFVDYGDVCIANMSASYASNSQYLIPDVGGTYSNGSEARILSRIWNVYRGAATSNITPIPDGSWFFPDALGNTFLAKLPTTVGAKDGLDRSSFIQPTLNIPARTGADRAVVQFGYAEFGQPNQYFCTARREACVAATPTVDPKVPFFWREIEPSAGVSCASGCQIQMPILPQHMAYFQILYHDTSSGQWLTGDSGVISELTVASIAGSITPALGLFGLQTTFADARTAQIKWDSNIPASGQAEYGVTSSYGTQSVIDSVLRLNRTLTVSGLSPATLYYVRAKSRDGAGNLATISGTFTTPIDESLGPLPNPILDLPATVPVNGDIRLANASSFVNATFVWTLTRLDDEASAPTAAPSTRAPTSVTSTSPAPQLALSPLSLALGKYLITVKAKRESQNQTSATASAAVTIVSADLSASKVFPNPWRKDRHSGADITFDNLSVGAVVKIFTVSGHLVRELPATSSVVTWNRQNDKGELVASGVYIYSITDSAGNKTRGKIAIVR